MATTFRRQQTQAMQRRLARRPGATGLLGLAGQFQSQIEQLTSQYETEFSQYQQRVAEMMAPYEQAMQRYTNEQLPSYEAAVAGFNQRLAEWQRQAEIAQQAPTRLDLRVTQYREGGAFDVEAIPSSSSNWERLQGQINSYAEQVRQFGLEPVIPRTSRGNLGMGVNINALPSELYYYEPDWFSPHTSGTKGYIYRRQGLAPDPFTEQRPEAPVLPEAPQIGEFDQSGFDRRRQELQTGFQREVAERRSARMAANRRTSRTMLSGVQ